MKRASIEPNFHELYMSFLSLFGSTQLRKIVLKETYRNIKVCSEGVLPTHQYSTLNWSVLSIATTCIIRSPLQLPNIDNFCLLQVILQADKTSNNFSDRAILKNLGRWLGLQTLAKNKPILQIVSSHGSYGICVHFVII